MEPDLSEPVIEIENLKKSFGENGVLKGFNLKLFKGENVVIMGRSGVGKSVLLKCIVGLINPDAGKILVFGKSVPDLDRKELDDMRMKTGFVFQNSALYDSMTVKENLMFPYRRQLNAETRPKIEEEVRQTLKDVGLERAIDMMPIELSGGMRKRIGLARALMLKPEVILYDEPTAGLDPVTGKEISKLIVSIQEKYHTSSLVITHDKDCARVTGNRIILLIDGKGYREGTYEELHDAEDSTVRQFFE